MTVSQIQANTPSLWKHLLPAYAGDVHKYKRGMAVIYGAPKMTGATRLAAAACARIGAGLVKVIAPKGTADIYRAALPAHIIVEEEKARPYEDARCRAVLMGPGTAATDWDEGIMTRVIKTPHLKGVVLDAGAFLYWQGESRKDLALIGDLEKLVVTPHEGEFATFFEGDGLLDHVPTKAETAYRASREINATVVFKGAQTVVAGQNDTIIQDFSAPELASAGTGDVLAGMIAGLIAQGMDVSHAAAASVWMHAQAGKKFGKGLVASDLPDLIPSVLKDLDI